MTDHIANRAFIIDAMRRELIGPSPAGQEIDISHGITLDGFESLNRPYRQAGAREEILTRDAPIKRYGIGVLFPQRAPLDEEATRTDETSGVASTPMLEISADAPLELDDLRLGSEHDDDDLDLSLANAYQPSSLGVSFLMEVPLGATLVVEASGGRYQRVPMTIRLTDEKTVSRAAWVRSPISIRAEFPGNDLIGGRPRQFTAAARAPRTHPLTIGENLDGLDLRIEVFARPRDDRRCLATVCLVNRMSVPGHGLPHAECLFQTHLQITVVSADGDAHILPYPGSHPEEDEEEEGLALLYRRAQTFATGHGCAADWEIVPGMECARRVSAACLPIVETPGVTPDITREDGSRLVVSMAALAGLRTDSDGQAELREVIERYEVWIRDIAIKAGLMVATDMRVSPSDIIERCDAWAKGQWTRADGATLDKHYFGAAVRNIRQCAEAARRTRDGLAYLASDSRARRAFQLANHAILLQQIITRDGPRESRYDSREQRLVVDGVYQEPDPSHPGPGRGNWRPFQIAFLLASLRSTIEGLDPDRDLVELIWFPTGGGKTEAYLGLSAFAMFKRRLDNQTDVGVHVLMRYTLRLLTAQQFQRAAGLICAMERLRAVRATELGSIPFSIGIWLGGDTTPNTRKAAINALGEIERSRYPINPFLLSRCPWCGAQFHRVELPGRGGTKGRKPNVLTPGLERYQAPGQSERTVRFVCPDGACPFSDGLPIYVVDEDVYDYRPTMVIGTIDKFAMLAWRPRARSLFGLDMDGQRRVSPPGLIIQDELHLIAGPLGSLAGLYETTIEHLCTDYRSATPVLPKIVSSTATIRRYPDQIRGLYARRRSALFPPPGLDADDSFFARSDKERPGRVYIGVHAASLGSVQTEWVRALAALLQAPMHLDAAGRDPWWTLLIFFNSIREMGTAHTLIQSDIPDYQRVIWEREGVPSDRRRFLRVVNELTGGLGSNEITGKMGELEIATTGTDKRRMPVDVCLASSIIEVGIDIPRLSLMVVAGQPKTTAQYIQVTGRVGRLRDRPGLVVTLYSPSKPRDRSHFERFRGYHERLYAHVEPTSVTPFSPPALDRALHAVLVAYARQQGTEAVAERPYPYPSDLIERFRQIVLERVRVVDPSEEGKVRHVLDTRAREWKKWQRVNWEEEGEDIPLLRYAGAYASREAKELSWATLTSMRNVDAECEADITTRYITQEGDDNA